MPTVVYKAITIGGSAGSMEALSRIFSCLPPLFNLPIIIACHLHPGDDGGLVEFFKKQQTGRTVKEAVDKEQIQAGRIYFPPANYHLLVEREKTFALSVDEKVNYARPSIDVFFESAALAWGNEMIGIILTGANMDGAAGIRAIKKHGGFTIAQDPKEAVHPVMPQAAIATGCIDTILSIKEICNFLHIISRNSG